MVGERRRANHPAVWVREDEGVRHHSYLLADQLDILYIDSKTHSEYLSYSIISIDVVG